MRQDFVFFLLILLMGLFAYGGFVPYVFFIALVILYFFPNLVVDSTSKHVKWWYFLIIFLVILLLSFLPQPLGFK